MDLAAVDALARLALAERRRGRLLRLAHVPADLRDLLELTGLAAVLLEAADERRLVEAGRQIEEREERVGVEEEGELPDPAV